jgi:DNA polymerase V
METGFPSPAQGYEDNNIDLGQTLVRHPAATYCMRMGSNYPQYGICRGDIIIVDRSLSPAQGQLVVYTAQGTFHCGRMVRAEHYAGHYAEHGFGEDGIIVFGTITYVIHDVSSGASHDSSC